MKKRRTGNLPIILTAGEYGLLSGRDVTEGMTILQIMQKLRERGMVFSGNTFSICSVVCSRHLCEKIQKQEDTTKEILILNQKDYGEKEIRKRFRKKKKIQLSEIIIAACSSELFSVIDQEPENFRILTLEESSQIILYPEEKGKDMG